jgi:hypothetical protein
MCYICCVQSCRIGRAGGVPPPPWRPSAWARPFPPEVAPTSCSDSCYGRPLPRRATSCERRRHRVEAEPLGECSCPGRGDPWADARCRHGPYYPRSSADWERCESDSTGGSRPVSCCRTRSASASRRQRWLPRRLRFRLRRLWPGAGGGFGGVGRGVGGATTARAGATRVVNVSSRITGDASATETPEAGAVSHGRLPSGKPIPPMCPGHVGTLRR